MTYRASDIPAVGPDADIPAQIHPSLPIGAWPPMHSSATPMATSIECDREDGAVGPARGSGGGGALTVCGADHVAPPSALTEATCSCCLCMPPAGTLGWFTKAPHQRPNFDAHAVVLARPGQWASVGPLARPLAQ